MESTMESKEWAAKSIKELKASSCNHGRDTSKVVKEDWSKE